MCATTQTHHDAQAYCYYSSEKATLILKELRKEFAERGFVVFDPKRLWCPNEFVAVRPDPLEGGFLEATAVIVRRFRDGVRIRHFYVGNILPSDFVRRLKVRFGNEVIFSSTPIVPTRYGKRTSWDEWCRTNQLEACV